MTDIFDLGPAAKQLSDLLRGITDDQLALPTPCPAYTLGDLVEHVGGLAVAFTQAATKESMESPDDGTPPQGDTSRLPRDWRDEFCGRLDRLAEAWRDPAAWQGLTKAGPIRMPGGAAAVVAADELVVHGWDVARSSAQPFGADEVSLQACLAMLEPMAAPERLAERGNAFGPPVAVADDAPLLDRVVALSGRDPAWQPN